MWYGMNKRQQKLLGIGGVLLFGFLCIIIITEKNILKDAQPVIVIILLVSLSIVALVSLVMHIQSGK